MSLPPSLSRYARAVRRSAGRLRPGHVVALSAVAVAAVGLAGLGAVDLPGPRPVTDRERMRIEVVHPVEPEIIAGSRMEVGELVDGFQGVPPPLPPLMDARWSYDEGPEDADDSYASSSPPDRRRAEVRTLDSQPEPERASPARIVQRWFGFDAPRRDFQAERAARRARLEAMEQAAREHRAREHQDWERQDWERSRHQRAEQDRYAAERQRVEARAPRWREDRRLDEPRDADWRGEALPDPDGRLEEGATQGG